jgi:hypothetical protein
MSEKTVSVYNNCYAYWYSNREGETQIGFKSEGKFNSIVKSYRVDLRSDVTNRAYLKVGEAGGGGVLDLPNFDVNLDDGDDYSEYLVNRVVWRK